MSRSKYTKEFRNETVELILNSEKSAIQIARDLGIHEKTIYNWIRIYKQEHNTISYKDGNQVSAADVMKELKQLKAENRILKQERDIFLCLHSL